MTRFRHGRRYVQRFEAHAAGSSRGATAHDPTPGRRGGPGPRRRYRDSRAGGQGGRGKGGEGWAAQVRAFLDDVGALRPLGHRSRARPSIEVDIDQERPLGPSPVHPQRCRLAHEGCVGHDLAVPGGEGGGRQPRQVGAGDGSRLRNVGGTFHVGARGVADHRLTVPGRGRDRGSRRSPRFDDVDAVGPGDRSTAVIGVRSSSGRKVATARRSPGRSMMCSSASYCPAGVPVRPAQRGHVHAHAFISFNTLSLLLTIQYHSLIRTVVRTPPAAGSRS